MIDRVVDSNEFVHKGDSVVCYLFNCDMCFPGIRECAICGTLATYECKNCFREFGDGLDKISFCDLCLTKVSILLLASFTLACILFLFSLCECKYFLQPFEQPSFV